MMVKMISTYVSSAHLQSKFSWYGYPTPLFVILDDNEEFISGKYYSKFKAQKAMEAMAEL